MRREGGEGRKKGGKGKKEGGGKEIEEERGVSQQLHQQPTKGGGGFTFTATHTNT